MSDDKTQNVTGTTHDYGYVWIGVPLTYVTNSRINYILFPVVLDVKVPALLPLTIVHNHSYHILLTHTKPGFFGVH